MIRTAQDARDHVIAIAQMHAEGHQEDHVRGGCTCGFCVWSVDHVLVMSMREALAGVGLVTPTDEDERTCPALEGESRCGTSRPCPVHMPYQYEALLRLTEQGR